MTRVTRDLAYSLEKIGLTKNEAAVYLSALKLGVAKASDIAYKAKIKREAAYYILKLLEEKGFISEVIKSGVKHYSATKPKRLLEIIEEEKQRKADTIKKILPNLQSLQKIAITKPKIVFYEGTEGLKTVASLMLEKENKEIYCYIPEKILHFIPSFHPKFHRRRREKNVFLKVITEKTKLMKNLKKDDKKDLREIRFNNAIIKGSDSAYYILPDGIVILKANEKEQTGMYIKEKTTAEMQKRIFEMLWRASKA
jgi:sugar-specific transcriptional regulator TrmB